MCGNLAVSYYNREDLPRAQLSDEWISHCEHLGLWAIVTSRNCHCARLAPRGVVTVSVCPSRACHVRFCRVRIGHARSCLGTICANGKRHIRTEASRGAKQSRQCLGVAKFRGRQIYSAISLQYPISKFVIP